MMTDKVTPIKAEDAGRDLRAEVARLMSGESRLSQAEISRQSGINSTKLSQWLNGRYPGDNETLEQDVARWLDAHRQRQVEQAGMPTAPTYVATPTSDRVLAALGYAQTAGDIAVIYGAAGLGKTTSIEQYQRTNPNVWVGTMSPCTKAAVPALEEVADALHLDVTNGNGAAKLQRNIIKRLRGSLGLIVIDEAQHLSVEALDAMRALHDATGIGLALVGNEAVWARMSGGHRAAYLDRLYSRVGKRVRLTRATKADIDALVGAWTLDAPGCRQLVHDIASQPGGLRGLTKVLRLASMFAAGARREVRCDDIRAAWRDLSGE